MDNEKKLNIIGLIIKLLIAIPALLFGFIVMSSGVNGDSDATAQQLLMDSGSFNTVIYICLFAILIAIALILIFFIGLVISRPKEGIKSILGIVIAAIIFFVLYLIGTSDTVASLNVQGDITVSESAMDFTNAGIYTTIIALIVCSLLTLGMGYVMKLVKNSKK